MGAASRGDARGLLETIREYAGERLTDAGEVAAVRCRHRDYYLAWAERAAPEVLARDQLVWMARIEAEHDNLRAALRCCIERGEAEHGVRLGAALSDFWLIHSHLREGREWLVEVLGLAGAATGSGPRTPARAVALSGAGFLAMRQSDYVVARSLFEEGLAIRRELGDRRGIASSLNDLGILADDQGDYALASSLHEQSLAIRRGLGDRRGTATSLNNLGAVAAHRAIASSLDNRGTGDEHQRDYALARRLLEQGLATRRELGDLQGVADSLNHLGFVRSYLGEYAAAQALYAESLAISQELGYGEYIVWSLAGFTALAAARGQPARALRLDGAAARLRDALGAPPTAIDARLLQRTLHVAGQMLGEDAAAAACAQGQALTLEEAIAYALGGED